jgi:hypothetical protein
MKRLFGAPRIKIAGLPELATIPFNPLVRVEAALEQIGGRWLVRIPLATGGNELALYTREVSEVKDDTLEVQLPEDLVRNLGLKKGQHLWIHNDGGRFSFEWEPER